MESPYFNSKTYQELMEATRARDLARRARSIRANLGYLDLKKRRWHRACRNLTLCLTYFRHSAAARPPNSYDLTHLAPAEAALAYARGEYQAARTALHSANISLDRHKRTPCAEVDFLLMAARRARAEGNKVSFEHFCRRAEALCQEYDLPLSARNVEAVRNGALTPARRYAGSGVYHGATEGSTNAKCRC